MVALYLIFQFHPHCHFSYRWPCIIIFIRSKKVLTWIYGDCDKLELLMMTEVKVRSLNQGFATRRKPAMRPRLETRSESWPVSRIWRLNLGVARRPGLYQTRLFWLMTMTQLWEPQAGTIAAPLRWVGENVRTIFGKENYSLQPRRPLMLLPL